MKKVLLARLIAVMAIACAPLARGDLYPVTDTNADPNVIEINLSSVEKDVLIGGTNVHAFVFKDENGAVTAASGGIPIPVIKAKVGDLIVCHYINKFTAESASV